MAIPGTPLVGSTPADGLEFVCMIAVTRLFCSKSVVRRVTGREQVSHELPPLCFLAGANSIFVGARLLTADIPGRSSDDALVADLKMRPMGRVLRAQHA